MSRQLGHMEHQFYRLIGKNGYNIVQIATVQGKLISKNLVAALSGVQMINSIPHFEIIPNHQKILLESHFKQEDKKLKTGKEIFYDELKNGYKRFLKSPEGFETSILWNLVVLSNEKMDSFDIILSFSHMILDGKSICVIMSELLKNLDAINNEKDVSMANIVEITPAIDELFVKFEPKTDDSEIKKYGEIFLDAEAVKKPFQQNVILKEYSAEKLIKLCKEHRVSVNSILYAAFLLSFVESCGNLNNGEWIYLGIPYCLRNKSNLAQNVVGSLATQFDVDIQWKDSYQDLLSEDIWKIAIEINQKVTKNVENNNCLARVHPHSLKTNPRLLLSNMGRSDDLFASMEKLKVSGLYTTISMIFGEPVCACHLTTLNNQIYFAFTSGYNLNSKLGNIASDTIDLLRKLSI
eukprot:gene4058-7347_t